MRNGGLQEANSFEFQYKNSLQPHASKPQHKLSKSYLAKEVKRAVDPSEDALMGGDSREGTIEDPTSGRGDQSSKGTKIVTHSKL